MDSVLKTAREKISSAESIAVITGAGVSQESGIPTFRGNDGYWKNFRAEDLATPAAFARDPILVWDWYDFRRNVCKVASPNPAHFGIVEIEKRKNQFLLITQNVDGLHRRAGSQKLLEIHGNIWKARCTSCNTIFDVKEVPLSENPVRCIRCGGLARPHIVWFGEYYDQALLDQCFSFLDCVDIVLIVGTSGMVPIPIQMGSHAKNRGAYIIDINPEPGETSLISNLVLNGKAGEIFPEILA